MPLGTKVGLRGLRDIVLEGDPAPLPKKGAEPPSQFSAHVYCGQTAGRMKTPLGTELELGSGHIVIDADPAPFANGAHLAALSFRPMLLSPWSPISAAAELLFLGDRL